MIFVTVGTQLPFERLMRAVDAWAGAHPAQEVFAQVGASAHTPLHMAWARTLDPEPFRQKFTSASLVVSHAGMGNVLLALECEKPMIVMPRRFDLGEHRNDHQMATAQWLKERAGFTVVFDGDELAAALDRTGWTRPSAEQSPAFVQLLTTVRDFIAAS